jgi:quercetin dioxygenase-like cupin family protein
MRRVIENPVSGERIVIRETQDHEAGSVLVFDLYLPPGGHVPAGHAHPEQEETFTVIAGRFRFRLGRRTVLAGPGATIVIPSGQAHWFGNAGDDIAHARVEVRPALRMEEFFEMTEAISRAGHFPGSRMPRLSDTALMLLEFRNEVAIPVVPSFLVTAMLGPLAWIARRRNRRNPPRSA